ncbi:MAG: hypothetical protein J7527_10190, partial [Chitinophagaceae bacterium]|nr:hypothetical protein [Chitinophagaceae bacterium]
MHKKRVASGCIVQTVRIPELTLLSSLHNLDAIAIWDSETNTTKHTTLQTLREFIEIGESGTYVPVQNGDSILYIVPEAKEGQDYAEIPGIAGMSFKLSRDGYPLKPQSSDPLNPDPEAEYEILSAGGFKLLKETLFKDQRWELEVYELNAGSIPTPVTGSSGFINGEVNPINTNYTVLLANLNKLHQIRGGSNALNIQLPDLAIVPERSFVAFECLINNQKQHAINTFGPGQYIYMNNEYVTTQYIGKGDVLFFYKTAEGWFVIIQHGNFINLTMPKAAYAVGFNQLLCDGSEYRRADYPKLWRDVEKLGASLIDDALWQTASVTVAGRTVQRPYKGAWSRGNGVDTFRVPDLMNSTLRGLKNDGGSDNQRHFNH